MKELVNNIWFITITCSILSLGIVPGIRLIANIIRARYGAFSGIYVAITTIGKEQIVELVTCRHIGNRLKGKILGVAILANEAGEEKVLPNTSNYDFKGIVRERLMVMSYNSVFKGDLSAGSLTLYGDVPGRTFSGNWGGLEEKEVVSSPCVWLKSSEKFNLQKDRELILNIVRFQSRDMMCSDSGSGKSHSIDFTYFDGV